MAGGTASGTGALTSPQLDPARQMPLDKSIHRFLGALAVGGAPDGADQPIERRRAALEALMRLSGPMAPMERREDIQFASPAGPLSARLFAPPGLGPGPHPALVYFHGGGLVAGSVQTHESIARALAAAAAAIVISVEYRLAPEHPFPAALDDALAVMQAVRLNATALGLDPARLGISGDSAGGTLAAAACRLLVDAGRGIPALMVLICPILDYAGNSASRRDLASGYLLEEATLANDLRHYLAAGVQADDPRISPLRARSLAGTPPTIVHTAEFDPLRDEGHEFAERARAAGSPVSYTCHSGMIHLFYGLGAITPVAAAAWTQIGADVRAAWPSADECQSKEAEPC